MLKSGANLGGEQSGHIIFLDHANTGDGLITALKLLSVMKSTGKKLSELATIMNKMPQILLSVAIDDKSKHTCLDDVEIRNFIGKIESEFKENGRVLVRPSGTEALVRIMIEGQCQEQITAYARKLAELITKKSG
jgi:phosphoglucosamine mutase